MKRKQGDKMKGQLKVYINEAFKSGVKTPKDIAKKIGVSRSHVRNEIFRMRKNGDYPAPNNRKYITIMITDREYSKLNHTALANNISVPNLITKLIKIIIQDELCNAVLDGD